MLPDCEGCSKKQQKIFLYYVRLDLQPIISIFIFTGVPGSKGFDHRHGFVLCKEYHSAPREGYLSFPVKLYGRKYSTDKQKDLERSGSNAIKPLKWHI